MDHHLMLVLIPVCDHIQDIGTSRVTANIKHELFSGLPAGMEYLPSVDACQNKFGKAVGARLQHNKKISRCRIGKNLQPGRISGRQHSSRRVFL